MVDPPQAVAAERATAFDQGHSAANSALGEGLVTDGAQGRQGEH